MNMRREAAQEVGLCPDCGKLISFHFPIHDCKPTPNFKRQQKKKRMNDEKKSKGYITGKTRFKTLKGLVRRCIKAGATDAEINAAGNFEVRWPECVKTYVMYSHPSKRGCMEIDIQLYFDLKG